MAQCTELKFIPEMYLAQIQIFHITLKIFSKKCLQNLTSLLLKQ